MKYLLTLVLLLPLLFTSKDAHAASPKVDSVYADSIIAVNNFPDSLAVLRKPDSIYAHLVDNGPIIDLSFKKYHSTVLQPIKKGSTILVWGKKDTKVDSSAGQITLNIYDDFLGMLFSSKRYILEDGLNIISVEDRDYSYVELSLADPVDPGSTTHAKSYYIDAVALLQDTTPPPKSVLSQALLDLTIRSYPNPFISNTTIRYELQTEGDVELAVIDGLGRETDRIVAGYQENGIHEIPLAIKTQGFYFVRLYLNGKPVGNPLKITSR